MKRPYGGSTKTVISSGGTSNQFLRTPCKYWPLFRSTDLVVDVCNGMPLWRRGPSLWLINHVNTEQRDQFFNPLVASFGIWNNPIGRFVLVRISGFPHAPRQPIVVWRPLVPGCVQSLTFPTKAEGSMPRNRVVRFDSDFLGQQAAYADQYQSGRPRDLRPPIKGEQISSCARSCAAPAPGNHRSRKQGCLA